MAMNRMCPISGASVYKPYRDRKVGTRRFLFLALLWFSIAMSAPAAASARGGEGQAAARGDVIELSGQIVDDRTGLPVTIFAMQWGEAQGLDSEIKWGYGTTAALTPVRNGLFRISRTFPAGRKVALRILANGYVPQPVTEPLSAPARIANLIVRLRPGMMIRGTVEDYAGQPVDSARVYLAGDQDLELVDGTPRMFQGSSTITNPLGEFFLQGGDYSSSQSIVVSSDKGSFVAVVPVPRPEEKMRIRLPEPARLRIRFDIPGAGEKAGLNLTFDSGETRQWAAARVRAYLEPVIRNGEDIELSLMPGKYHLSRGKMLDIGIWGRGFGCDGRDFVLVSGETEVVDLTRKDGLSIEGVAAGLKESGAEGAFVTVRAAEATGDPRNYEETMSLFDAVTCNPEDGSFRTALLSPGTYTVVVEAYLPQTPEQLNHTGIRLPDFIGTAKVTVAPDKAPLPVEISLRPVR